MGCCPQAQERAGLEYSSPRLQKGHRSRSWDPRGFILPLDVVFSIRTAQRLLLCTKSSQHPQPCLPVWCWELLSDLEGLKLSEWEQYWLLKSVGKKRLLKVDVSLFLDKTGLQEAHPWPWCSLASKGPIFEPHGPST